MTSHESCWSAGQAREQKPQIVLNDGVVASHGIPTRFAVSRLSIMVQICSPIKTLQTDHTPRLRSCLASL